MKNLTLTLALFLVCAAAAAQSLTIRGKVALADDPLPAIGALAKLNAADSAKINQKGRVVASDVNGAFSLVSREKKNAVTVSYMGYKDKTVEVAPDAKGTVNLGTITLEPQAEMIENVKIVGDATMAKIIGDTTQYNAAAFKTNPDASAEDLLKKMPGVTTDENGKVQSQGQTISKVLVNGKEFFESDPSAALKNLPVDAVESMQIYDAQSDDAKFSGFDDGERIRTVNIVTKAGVNNSIFGKAYGGGGIYAPGAEVLDRSMRYAGGLGLNIWRGDHRFTIIAQANNVNNQGFTLSDVGASSSRRGGRGRIGSGGTDISGFSTSTRGGIQQSYMAGFNYNGTFSEKFKMSAAYMYNGVGADIWNARDQQYLTTPRVYQDTTSSTAFQNSHSLSIRTEWNPNENNRITFNPSLSYNNNFGDKSTSSLTFLDGALSNTSRNIYSTNLERMSGSADLWWQHSFGKSGRTLSLGGVIEGRHDEGARTQLSQYSSFDLNNQAVYDTIRQIGTVWGSGYTVTGSATYTEPISKSSRLSLNYSINYDRSISDKKGWNWDKLMQDYALLDTTTTNYFNRDYTTHVAGLGYNYTLAKKLTLAATVNYQYATMNNDQVSPNAAQTGMNTYNFEAVLPSLRISFTPSKGENLNFNYNATSIFPSVNQLQDVLDVDNPLQVSKGNPNLRQSYSNNLSLRYSMANLEKNINFSVMGMGNMTSDYISTHRRFLTQDTVVNGTTLVRGAQFSEPVNLDGYVNARVFANFGFGIKPIKSNLNFSLMYSFARTPSIEDGVNYMSYSNRIGGSVSLTSNISENIDFTLFYRPSVNLTEAGTGRFDRYYGHNVGAFVNVIFLKYFFVNVDATWNNSFGTQESYTQHFALLNAAVGAKFLKNRQAEVRLACYDLLDQNRSFYTQSNDTYIQTTTQNILRQYFMLSFTYKFDTRKNKSAVVNNTEGNFRRGMGGMGGGYPH